MANLDTYIFIKWSDSDYSTGIKTIDDQHKQLLSLINEIYQSFLDYKHLEVTSNVLERLEEYATYHFAFEEKIFKQLDYEDMDSHIESHRAFFEKIQEFKRQMAAGNDVTFGITNYLREWLRTHIQKEDRAYAPLFQKSGIN